MVPRSNAAQPGILKFYDQEAQGIKMTPTQVLVISLVFIALVVLLHIWGKMRGGSKEEESTMPKMKNSITRKQGNLIYSQYHSM